MLCSYLLRAELHKKKNGKKDDIMHLSNYPHPPGLIVDGCTFIYVTGWRVTYMVIIDNY